MRARRGVVASVAAVAFAAVALAPVASATAAAPANVLVAAPESGPCADLGFVAVGRVLLAVTAPYAVLMIGKTDCDHCAEFTEELHAFLAEDRTHTDVRFGKMLIDKGGLVVKVVPGCTKDGRNAQLLADEIARLLKTQAAHVAEGTRAGGK